MAASSIDAVRTSAVKRALAASCTYQSTCFRHHVSLLICQLISIYQKATSHLEMLNRHGCGTYDKALARYRTFPITKKMYHWKGKCPGIQLHLAFLFPGNNCVLGRMQAASSFICA